MNVGSQNTQQIGEKLESQPVQTPKKSKVNPWLISTVVLGILLILLTSLYVQNSKIQESEVTKVNQPILPSPTSTTENQNAAPQKNSLYLGMHEGKEVIFYTNDLADERGTGAGGIKIEGGPYTGSMAAVGDKPLGYSNPYDFRQLLNPKKVADNFPSFIGLVVDARYGTTKNILYVSLLLDSRQESSQRYVSSKNVVYKISLGNMGKQEVWSTELKKGQYKDDDTDFAGAADINQVIEDKYLILSIGLCFECSPYSEKRGILVLNINTTKEKFLGMVGDITIHTLNNTVTYKNLEAVTESCPTDIAYCNDSIGSGQRHVYKPAGQIVTETLP